MLQQGEKLAARSAALQEALRGGSRCPEGDQALVTLIQARSLAMEQLGFALHVFMELVERSRVCGDVLVDSPMLASLCAVIKAAGKALPELRDAVPGLLSYARMLVVSTVAEVESVRGGSCVRGMGSERRPGERPSQGGELKGGGVCCLVPACEMPQERSHATRDAGAMVCCVGSHREGWSGLGTM